ncbi:MAG: TrkA C-terminal domain-containing protein [Myxococcales bacterium]|nr:TrkA C-terminal domain-containing protein [Myxococcales bacterium]MCB9670350.1 TrkA C-terminal domain-containing protein [Alphaproteobacteria bacterium]MCB9693395.1 TrkA C-terminal domain-containing protein [Alphaproteobacteria bacterium]
MGSVIALVVILALAYVIVVAGAAAYELTGLERNAALFQSLSAFTGTGFTTLQAEKVVEHKVRRNITMTLIILGYAAAATVVATLVQSVEVGSIWDGIWHVSIALTGVIVSWAFFRSNGMLHLNDFIRRWVATQVVHEPVLHDDLFRYKPGFGITRIEVPTDSRVVGKRLMDLDLKELQLQVLLIEMEDDTVVVPDGQYTLQPLSHLVVFGRLDAVQRAFAPETR